MQIYLIRHPRPLIETDICYGQSDIGVGDFADDVARIRRLLHQVRIDRSVSSPLSRCRLLAQALDLPNLSYDDRLQELNFGDWELRAWDKIDRAQIDDWSQDVCLNAPPNGESFAALSERVEKCLRSLESDQTVVLVTHAGVIRAILAQALGLQLAHSFRLQIDFAHISRIDFSLETACVRFINR